MHVVMVTASMTSQIIIQDLRDPLPSCRGSGGDGPHITILFLGVHCNLYGALAHQWSRILRTAPSLEGLDVALRERPISPPAWDFYSADVFVCKVRTYLRSQSQQR